MGNIFSNRHHQQENEHDIYHQKQAAAAATAERQRQRERERKAEQERQRQEQERERERQEQEQERLLQHARAQAALRLRSRRPLFTPSSHDKYGSYADRDWEWHPDRAQANNNDNDYDDNDDRRDDQGYTDSDGYYRIPQHHHHLDRRQTQRDNEHAWRGLKKTNKAYTPPSGNGRRKRCRKGKGDLYENDYHAGYSKPEILAMSSERKATFETQKLRRRQRESVVSA